MKIVLVLALCSAYTLPIASTYVLNCGGIRPAARNWSAVWLKK